MKEYEVTVEITGAKTTPIYELLFMAEGIDHAIEQAQDAISESEEIISVNLVR